MPLDHYVSQVHLRKFYSPALGDRMYAMRKSDLKTFTPNSKVVCVINDGNTNAFLQQDRVIEELLKTIEPNYNVTLQKLLDKRIDHECIYTIAAFIAYVIACSPAGMRILTAPLKNMVETSAITLDAQGVFDPPPPELGGDTFTELLRSGAITIDVDPKYPQALGINSILENVAMLGNFQWEILCNDFDDSPFFTSDFPIAVETTDDPRILNRIVPLAPNIALRITPDRTLDRHKVDFTFTNFRYHTHKLRRHELATLNRLIVRCAEETVFFRDDHPWVQPFIAKNRDYRIETSIREIETPRGKVSFAIQKVVQRTGQD